MKKLVSVLLCLVLFLPAAALAEDGWFANAELSAEEDALLELIMMDEEYAPYDFKAPEGATLITLTLLEMKDGQWSERLTATRVLTSPSNATELTITATLNEQGHWDAHVHQNERQPDGRIYIDIEEAPNRIGLNIQQPRINDYTSNITAWYSSYEDYVNTFGLYCWRRTFLHPEQKGYLQQKAVAVLNEPTLLELFICTREWAYSVPDFSKFNTPEAFSEFDYAFAVTATFSAERLQEAD